MFLCLNVLLSSYKYPALVHSRPILLLGFEIVSISHVSSLKCTILFAPLLPPSHSLHCIVLTFFKQTNLFYTHKPHWFCPPLISAALPSLFSSPLLFPLPHSSPLLPSALTPPMAPSSPPSLCPYPSYGPSFLLISSHLLSSPPVSIPLSL